MGEVRSTPPRRAFGAHLALRLAAALPLGLVAGGLTSSAQAQENLAEDTGESVASAADAHAPVLQSAPRSSEPGQSTPPAAFKAPGFKAAFAPLAEAPHPDLAVPESAVDLTAIEPEIEAPAFRSLGTGTASYYGRRFHGRRTANGERFDMNALTAAHRTLPFGSMVRVTNPANGKSVTVRINDRGPFSRGRVIDVSRAAAEELGLIRRGHGPVELELLE